MTQWLGLPDSHSQNVIPSSTFNLAPLQPLKTLFFIKMHAQLCGGE